MQIIPVPIIRSQIIDTVKENFFYSIIVDGTSDITTREQISFCVRYSTSLLEIKEQFIGFFQVENTTGDLPVVRHFMSF